MSAVRGRFLSRFLFALAVLPSVFSASANTTNRASYEESFESYPVGFVLSNTGGWYAEPEEKPLAVVTNPPLLLSALAAYTNSGGTLPISTTHDRILHSLGVTNEVRSPRGEMVFTDMMLWPRLRETMPDGDRNAQFSLCFDTNGHTVIWHRNSTTGSNEWRVLAGARIVNSNEWIRLSFAQDYARHMFQIRINEGAPIEDAAGWTAGGGSQPGSWFFMVQTNGYMSRLMALGESFLDDLTVRSDAPHVATRPPTAVTAVSATMNGALSWTGFAPTVVQVYWGERDGGTNALAWARRTRWTGTVRPGSLSTNITGLQNNRLYFYRFHAASARGDAWATESESFLTGEVTVQATDPSAAEAGADPGWFLVSRPVSATNAPLLVTYTVTGTATPGSDYEAFSGELTIPAGAVAVPVRVTPRDDAVWGEGTETVVVSLNGIRYTLGATRSATVGIADDDDFSFWPYRTKVSFSGYNRGEALTNFPALVVLGTNIPGFRYETFALAGGRDLWFATTNGLSYPAFEVDTWDPNGRSYLWVRLPALTGRESLWAYWGNASTARPPAATSLPVWHEGFAAVWHMKETSPQDATGRGHHGTANGNTNVAGLVGTAQGMASASYVRVPSHADFAVNDGDTTWSAWIKTSATIADSAAIMAKNSYLEYVLRYQDPNTIRFQCGDASANLLINAPFADAHEWMQVTYVHDSGFGTLYVNGMNLATGRIGALAYDASKDLLLGYDAQRASGLDGLLDEVRVASVARSSNWVWASWMTVVSNADFTTYSPVAEPIGIRTDPATQITLTTATLNGTLLSAGSLPTAVWVYWGPVDAAVYPLGWANRALVGTNGPAAPVALSRNVASPGPAMYHYRFFAQNAAGQAWAPASASFLAGAVTVAATDPTATEGSPDTGTFTITRPASGTVGDLPIQYTMEGVAQQGLDYQPLTGTALIPSGQQSVNVTLIAVDDDVWQEGSEPATLRLAAGAYTVGAPSTATVNIRDNDTRTDWIYRMKITFAGYAGTTPLVDFPALVVFGSNLNGFAYHQFASPMGYDLRFGSGDESATLRHEVERWDPAGQSYVWVRVPRITGSDSAVYAYWGNRSATNAAPAYTRDGSTWAGDFTLVQHMADRAGNAVTDSSASRRTSTAIGTYTWQAPGAIGPALHLHGTADDRIDLGTDDNVPLASAWTIGAWFMNLQGNTRWRALANGNSGDSQILAAIGVDNLGSFDAAGQTGFHDTGYLLNPALGQWHHLVAVGANGMTEFFLDGVAVATNDTQSGTDLRAIGNDRNGGRKFAEYLDEVRVSTVSRSADWVRAEWMNAVSNAVFAQVAPVGRTEPDLPLIFNSGVTSNVTATAATLYGNLVFTGSAATAVIVYWGPTDVGPTATGWARSVRVGNAMPPGPFTYEATGLTPATVYYYRFLATNQHGGRWSPDSTRFKTLGEPAISNQPPTDVFTVSMRANASVLSTGVTPTRVWAYWGESDGGTVKTSWGGATALGVVGLGPVNAVVTGLKPGTRYYYRFYASNAHAQAWAPGAQTLTTMSNFTWDGGGANDEWSTPGNWVGDAAPPSDGSARIVFGGSVRTSPNAGVPWDVYSITFANDAAAFALRGSPLSVRGGGIRNQDADSRQTISNAIQVAADQTWQTAAAASPLLLAGNLSGAQNVTLDLGGGDRSVQLSGNNAAYAGTLRSSGAAGILLANANAGIGGRIDLSTADRRLFVGGAGSPGTYRMGIGPDAGEIQFQSSGTGGIIAWGGDATWDPGNGADYTLDAPVLFNQADGSGLRLGNAARYLRVASGAHFQVAGGVVRVLSGLGDDGVARTFDVSGAGLCILGRAADPAALPGSTVNVRGALAVSSMTQLFDGNLSLAGSLILDNVTWSQFATDRAGGYGSGTNQWQLAGGGFAARRADVVIDATGTDAATFDRDFRLGSSVATGGVLFADRTVEIAREVSIAPTATRTWTFHGPNDDAAQDRGWTLPAGVPQARISGRITGGDAAAKVKLNGPATGSGGGTVVIRNIANDFRAVIEVGADSGQSSVIAVFEGEGAFGDAANSVTVGQTAVDQRGSMLFLSDPTPAGASTAFGRNLTVRNRGAQAGGDLSGWGSWAGEVLYTGTVAFAAGWGRAATHVRDGVLTLGAAVTPARLDLNPQGADRDQALYKHGAGRLVLDNVTVVPKGTRAWWWQIAGGTLVTVTNGQLRSSGLVSLGQLLNNGPAPVTWQVSRTSQACALSDGAFGFDSRIAVDSNLTLTTQGAVPLEAGGGSGARLVKAGQGTWVYNGPAASGSSGSPGSSVIVDEGTFVWNGRISSLPVMKLSGGTILIGNDANFGAANAGTFAIEADGGKLGLASSRTADAVRTDPIAAWDQSAVSTVRLAARDNLNLVFGNSTFPDIEANTTLLIERDGAAGGIGHVRVDDANLTVNGTIGGFGALKMQANGSGGVTVNGKLNPDGERGVLSFAGSLEFGPNARLDFALGNPDTSDRVNVAGALTMNGALHVTDQGGLWPGLSYVIFTYTGTLRNNGLTVGSMPAGLVGTINTNTPGEVQLDVTAGQVLDADGDGILDSWETRYGTTARFSRTGDADRDGVSDYREYIADTVPTNAASFFRIRAVSNVAGRVTVYFTTSADRRYSVSWTEGFAATNSWRQSTNNVSGTGRSMALSPSRVGARTFYRLGVDLK